jgi:uncharacterized membrane protein YphA (DoxX/SURF4 family)
MRLPITRILKQTILTACRWYLSLLFLIYGVAKIYPGQFPSHTRVIYDSAKNTPFELAWAFFGHSRLYEIFIGAGEVTSALLLLFPRTKTLGAVLYFPIVINVWMVNICFDIGVQDLSTLLVLMCICLLYADRKKLLRIFDNPLDSKTTTDHHGETPAQKGETV